jgi:pimeloyl-ACP methyl ester carboxylesterase
VNHILTIFILWTTFGAWTVMAHDEQFLFGDSLPDAPELSQRGDYGVGVRTLQFVNPDQVDVLNLVGNPEARYDRPLTVEVWYPAIIPDDDVELTEYHSHIGRADQNNVEPYTFQGRALRDAKPDTNGVPFPLLILSHGFPGSRFMLSYLTENLASKGFVVVAIGHTDSTYPDTSNFSSTLLNRSMDQMFVLNEVAKLSEADSFLNGLVDADNTAIIGYSMGGYGALNSVGAGYNQILQGFIPQIEPRMADNPDYQASLDDRIKAIVVFAPWGGDISVFGAPKNTGVWDAEAFAGIQIPSFWVAGTLDDVSGYEAMVDMFDNSVNSERYLLTYDNAFHNVAPNPPSPFVQDFTRYEHRSEPMWDERRINNINQHFVTAFLNQYLYNQDHSSYLKPAVEDANLGVVSLDNDGNPKDDHTYWAGFLPRTAVGMTLRAESVDN